MQYSSPVTTITGIIGCKKYDYGVKKGIGSPVWTRESVEIPLRIIIETGTGKRRNRVL